MSEEYEVVKKILIKHDVLHKDIDQLDDEKLMLDLYMHFQDQMPYGTQKARTGDPDEFIYDALEDLGLPLGNGFETDLTPEKKEITHK